MSNPNNELTHIDSDNEVAPVSIFDKSVRQDLLKCITLGIIGQIFVLLVMLSIVNILYSFPWNHIPYQKVIQILKKKI